MLTTIMLLAACQTTTQQAELPDWGIMRADPLLVDGGGLLWVGSEVWWMASETAPPDVLMTAAVLDIIGEDRALLTGLDVDGTPCTGLVNAGDGGWTVDACGVEYVVAVDR